MKNVKDNLITKSPTHNSNFLSNNEASNGLLLTTPQLNSPLKHNYFMASLNPKSKDKKDSVDEIKNECSNTQNNQLNTSSSIFNETESIYLNQLENGNNDSNEKSIDLSVSETKSIILNTPESEVSDAMTHKITTNINTKINNKHLQYNDNHKTEPSITDHIPIKLHKLQKNKPQAFKCQKVNNIDIFQEVKNNLIDSHITNGTIALNNKDFLTAAKSFKKAAQESFLIYKKTQAIKCFKYAAIAITNYFQTTKFNTNLEKLNIVSKTLSYYFEVINTMFEKLSTKHLIRYTNLSEKIAIDQEDENTLQLFFHKVNEMITSSDILDLKIEVNQIEENKILTKIAKHFTFNGFLAGQSNKYEIAAQFYKYAYELHIKAQNKKIAAICLQEHKYYSQQNSSQQNHLIKN